MHPRVRGPRYTHEDDLAICKAYVHHTLEEEVVMVGANNSIMAFWQKVFVMFTAETDNIYGHDASGLQHHFSVINRNVLEFVSQLQLNHRNKLDGEADHEVLPRILVMWLASHVGRPFNFHACFNILRVLNKYNPYCLEEIPSPA